jgi:hypothetical protein
LLEVASVGPVASGNWASGDDLVVKLDEEAVTAR